MMCLVSRQGVTSGTRRAHPGAYLHPRLRVAAPSASCPQHGVRPPRRPRARMAAVRARYGGSVPAVGAGLLLGHHPAADHEPHLRPPQRLQRDREQGSGDAVSCLRDHRHRVLRPLLRWPGGPVEDCERTNIAEFKMYIFDRWGKIMFESEDINVGWPGRSSSSNEPLIQDVYVYKIIAKDIFGETHKYIGRVTLLINR